MKLVVDANVVISALIADSKTRELIVTLEPDLLTPEFVYGEIENCREYSESWVRSVLVDVSSDSITIAAGL